MPELELKILDSSALEQILAFEQAKLATQIADEMERELYSWNARWRKESLEHYLNLGWSFGVWQDQELVGYALDPPLLFFRGQTQSLWVDQLSARNLQVTVKLIECLYRWSRDKHLQTILFSEGESHRSSLADFGPVRDLENSIVELRTSRS